MIAVLNGLRRVTRYYYRDFQQIAWKNLFEYTGLVRTRAGGLCFFAVLGS